MKKQNKIFLLVSIFALVVVSLNFIPGISGAGDYSNYGANFGTTTSSIGNVYSSGFQDGYRVYGSSVNPQFNNPSFYSGAGYTDPSVYWSKFRPEDCYSRQDFIIQIAPGGCSPAVVRSDLLEEQNVPVFCRIQAIQVNPLIDISRIRSLRFSGQYPKGISGVSYFPARAAVRSQNNLISSPLKDNLGYLVITLSRNEIEREMPDFINATITASIDYDAENALGIGRSDFYLDELLDSEWERDYQQYGFWNGKGYLRLDSVYDNGAVISIYRDKYTKQSTVNLKKGETSGDIYLSGFYCSVGMNLKLESIGIPIDSALIQVNGEQMWVSKGDRILDNKCTVVNIYTYGGGGRVSINCPVKNGRFDLSLNPGKASLIINGQKKELSFGDRVENDKNIYVGYVGQDIQGNNFVVLINDSFSYSELEFESKEIYQEIDSFMKKNKKLNLVIAKLI